MALADATNVVATDAPIATATKTMSQASDVPNAPNAEKLVAALDDVASFDAAKRDAAAAKLDAASAKDAPGLCIALLRVASDDKHGSARRLAAGTFARNLLRKAFWTPEKDGASFPDAYRAAVRVAALDALCAAPDGPSRALIAECLRLAGAVPASAVGSSHTFIHQTSSSSPEDPSEDPRADLALDVCERLAKHGSSFVASPGFLLATHAAARPFQYFRVAATARESAPAALETLCANVIAPHVVPMCGVDDARVRRVALKVAFRAVRAYMPDALRGEAIRSIVGSISRSTLTLRNEGTASSEEDWIAAKRALRLAKALVTRHASMLDSSAFRSIVGACVGVAGVEPGLEPAADAAVAEAFACLESVLSATREPKPTSDAAWAGLTDDARDDAQKAVSALKDIILECVVPHANLSARDEDRLTEDPEEYARVNAVGDVAIADAIEEALAGDGGGSSCGITARGAALEFAQALVETEGPAGNGAEPPAKKRKKDTKKDTKKDGEDGEGKAPPPTPGESALKDVVDAILAEAPKEKIEKVGKSAAAAGAVATYAAPVAEAALGASKYFGLFQLAAALASAQARRGSAAVKDSAMRQFCQRHAFPAAAAAYSPHVAAAAAKFIADALVVAPVRTNSSAPLLREGVAALIAAIEREWDRPNHVDDDDDDDDDDGEDPSVDEEGIAVVKDIASWAAKSVLEDAPAASEAFGTLAVGAVDASCERLLALVEASPAHSTPALRVLGAMAGVASGAMTPTAAAGRVERIVAAFAPFAPSNPGEDFIHGDDCDVPLDAWEASVDACAALVEAATAWDAPEGASDEEAREGETATAAAAAAHVAAYWRAAESLEPSADDDDDDDEADGDETDDRAPPPAHAAVASLLRAAAEVLASRVSDEKSATDAKPATFARLAADVRRVCAEWARHLPAWRRQGEAGLVDDASLDDLRDIVAAVSTAAGDEDEAVAAMAGPGAATAAAVLEDSDDEATRRAAAGALAACVSAPGFRARVPESSLNFFGVAIDNAEGATTGRRSARAALHLLAAVSASSGFAASSAGDALNWLRVRCECAGVAGWTVEGGDDACVNGALLGAHVASLHAALAALAAPGAPQPDKKVFGAALGEAVRAAATLLASPEDGDDDEEDDDSVGEDDSDDEATIRDGLENETEEEFLERYAAIARDMADGTAFNDDDDDDDDEGCDEEDSAFDAAFEATRGDGARDATAFARWFETWRAGDTRGVRVSSVVDGVAAKALAKAAANR